MDITEIKHGTRLKLILNRMESDGSSVVVASRFEEKTRKGNITITAPFRLNAAVIFRSGEEMSIEFVQGKDNVIITFRATFVRNVRAHGVLLVELKPISELVRKQVRSDFRLKIMADIKIAYTEKQQDPENPKKVFPDRLMYTKAILVDISGGGAALYTNISFEKGDKMNLYLIDEKRGTETELSGAVVYTKDVNDPDSIWPKFVGIQFEFKTRLEKEKVVTYVFEKQREQLKKKPTV